MDWYQLFSVMQAVVMAITTVLVYVVGLRRQIAASELERIRADITELKDATQAAWLYAERVKMLEFRMDRAGKEQSEWANKTQVLMDWFHEERGRRRKDRPDE